MVKVLLLVNIYSLDIVNAKIDYFKIKKFIFTFFFLQATMPSLGDSFATLIFNLCFILNPPLSWIFVAVYPLLTIWRFGGGFDHPIF
jgi:hypothetical protein